jgi:hypothetical protein
MIVTAASAAEWGEEAVLELADLVGRFRPRTIVINTVPGGRGPDRILGCEAAAGLTAISRGEVVVRDVARSPADRPFLYVPAGQPAEVLGELAHRPAFLHLLKAAARGGTLLLHASEEDLGALIGQPDGRAALHAFDGYVIFGDRSTFAPPLSGVPLLARVERPIPGSRLSDAVEQDTAGSAFAPALAEISGRRRRQGRTRWWPSGSPSVGWGWRAGHPSRRISRDWLDRERRPRVTRRCRVPRTRFPALRKPARRPPCLIRHGARSRPRP